MVAANLEAGFLIRDEAAKAWFDTIRKSSDVTLGERFICRHAAARKWDKQVPDEAPGVTLGQLVIATCDTVLKLNADSPDVYAKAVAAVAARDWAAFFAAIMPFIKLLLEMLLPLFL